MSYIWQNSDWPNFHYDKEESDFFLKEFIYAKGLADATFNLLSKSSRTSVYVDAITQEAICSSQIEGESLDYDSVYSSIMKRLDPEFIGKTKDRNSESVSNVLYDARNNHEDINIERLFFWNKSLFDGKAKHYIPETCGKFRNKPVYVIHHLPIGNDEIVYEAVPADSIMLEIEKLVSWINGSNEENALIKSAIAGLWFVTIHPFADGNGRISRAVSDYVISKDRNYGADYYSVSASILKNKKEYYSILEKTQKQDSMDITEWICWYIRTVTENLHQTEEICSKKIKTSLFIKSLDPSEFNSRQLQMLYKMADDSFVGKLTAEKWMKITKCQRSTATRDLSHLVEKGLLVRLGGSGKNYHYVLNPSTIPF